MLEGEVAPILQDVNAVVRLQQKWRVQAVAVGVENIEFPVAVKVGELDAARSVCRVRRRVDGLLAKASLSLIDKRDDGFVLLADKGHEVELAIAVDVRDRNVNGAMAVVQHARDEVRRFPIGCLV